MRYHLIDTTTGEVLKQYPSHPMFQPLRRRSGAGLVRRTYRAWPAQLKQDFYTAAALGSALTVLLVTIA